MSAEPPRCPVCAHAVESVRDEAGWWALPCGHALGRWNFEDIRARLEAARPLWHFNVPEVSATAIKDRDGDVWLHVRSSRWADAVEVMRGQPYPDYEFVDLLAFAPLVECEDPRSTP